MATKPPTQAKTAVNERFDFRTFDGASFAATKEAWMADAASGEGFAPDVEQSMTWTAGHIALVDNEVAYGIFDKSSQIAVGICELAITKPSIRGKWVKMIRLRLRPTIEGMLFKNDPDGVVIAVSAYVSSVLGVYHVKNEHKATIIKVYGRTQEQMRFLTLLSAALKKGGEATFESKIEGRWLVLNWGKT